MKKETTKYNLTEKEILAYVRIRRGYCHSRADVARDLNISRPTASIIVEKLINIHAVCETGPVKAKRGKSPINLVSESDFLYSVGLDLGYSKHLVGVLLDSRNRIVKKAIAEFDNTSLESIREKSLEIIEKLSMSHPLCGIGIALTGVVIASQGKILSSVNHVFASNPIRDLFYQWTQLPVRISNRSRVEAFSEAVGGAVDLQKDFILCSLGESIDAAFFINGNQLLGTNYAAGTIRYLRIHDGRTFGEALTPEAVDNYSEDELVTICADGLFQLMSIMDLRQIVLSGRFTDFGSSFLKKLTASLSREMKCLVVYSHFKKFSAARGAAMAIAEMLPSQPSLNKP